MRNRARSLQLLVKSQNGHVRVAHAAAVTRSPSSPRMLRNTVLGGVLGLLVGLVIASVIERLTPRMRKPEDLARMYRLPLLGIVPSSTALSRRSRPLGEASLDPLPRREQEAFELIRARLRYFKIDRELRTLLVVSASPGEGKTTIARHLASAAARVGSAVLLLEADLRQPALARQLGLQPGPGLADVLIGEQSLWSATQLVDVDSSAEDGSAVSSLDVLAAGVPLPPNPAKLIESQAMETVLQEARSTHDLVVIDTSPLAAVSDAFALLPKVDGVIVVGRGRRNLRRASAQRLRASLDAADAPLVGVIANCVNDRQHDAYADASYVYRHPAASAQHRWSSADRRPASQEYDDLTGRRSPPGGGRNGVSRSSARFRRRAAGRQLRSEDDPRPTASP